MSPELGVLIMMNNYFHDVATALLLASAFLIWVIMKRYEESSKGRETTEYFLSVYRSSIYFAKFSLLWIIIGGIPRTYFYTEFEWANAAGRSQITALIVKHVLAFIFVGLGSNLWFKVHRRVKEIRNNLKSGNVR